MVEKHHQSEKKKENGPVDEGGAVDLIIRLQHPGGFQQLQQQLGAFLAGQDLLWVDYGGVWVCGMVGRNREGNTVSFNLMG